MRNQVNRESELRALLEQLNLDGMAAIYPELALRAAKENLSHEVYLYELARYEKDQRNARRTARLLRQPGLPTGKTFQTFHPQWQFVNCCVKSQRLVDLVMRRASSA
ncbi:MAG: hypothetical protein J2P36_00300 [Ktedonobacteraceae bacterium]|nr:hypothetical protein [Ktedonobacteraceae bacterium]